MEINPVSVLLCFLGGYGIGRGACEAIYERKYPVAFFAAFVLIAGYLVWDDPLRRSLQGLLDHGLFYPSFGVAGFLYGLRSVFQHRRFMPGGVSSYPPNIQKSGPSFYALNRIDRAALERERQRRAEKMREEYDRRAGKKPSAQTSASGGGRARHNPPQNYEAALKYFGLDPKQVTSQNLRLAHKRKTASLDEDEINIADAARELIKQHKGWK